jgi:hypothetical protein
VPSDRSPSGMNSVNPLVTFYGRKGEVVLFFSPEHTRDRRKNNLTKTNKSYKYVFCLTCVCF